MDSEDKELFDVVLSGNYIARGTPEGTRIEYIPTIPGSISTYVRVKYLCQEKNQEIYDKASTVRIQNTANISKALEELDIQCSISPTIYK